MSEKVIRTSIGELPQESLFDGKVLRKVFQTRNIEIVEYIYRRGAHFPEHSHREEQVTVIESGEINFYLDGELLELKEGDICYIPPHTLHSARVTGSLEVRTMNIFHPARATRP